MAERATLTTGPRLAIPSWIESVPGETGIVHNEVHVWRLNLRGAAASEELLSADERRRAAQMTAPAARLAFVATLSTLRVLLARYSGSDANTLSFSKGEHGKPRLDRNDSSLEFNLSHSGDWALIAITSGIPVGVDVEQVRAERAKPELAERFFSPRERTLLEQRREFVDDLAFFQLWARKEAYLKAIGVGLTTRFGRIDASTDGLPDLNTRDALVSLDPVWYAAEFMVDDAHPACVVARSPNFSLTLYTFDRLAP